MLSAVLIKLGQGNDDAAHDALAAFPGGLHIDGGITGDNAETWPNHDASHVIVTDFIRGQKLRYCPSSPTFVSFRVFRGQTGSNAFVSVD